VWNHGNGWDDENVYRVARKIMNLNVRRRGEIVVPAKGSAKDSVSIRRIRAIGGKKFRHALFHTSIMKAIKHGASRTMTMHRTFSIILR
jgi:hypothetical protein